MQKLSKASFKSLFIFIPMIGIAFFFGTVWGNKSQSSESSSDKKAESSSGIKFWTCSMHPQIKMPNNDAKCPICFMDLVPVSEGESSGSEASLVLDANATKLIELESSPVLYRTVAHETRLFGKVTYDETKVESITLWTPGKSRLSNMFVAFTGESVKKGDSLVEVYSPDLIAAQGEYLSAYKSYQQILNSNSRIRTTIQDNLLASKRKLIDLGMTSKQVRNLENVGKAEENITLYSPVTGTVIQKLVNEGEWHNRGMSIYQIADLSQLWIQIEAYETDIAWTYVGQEIQFFTQSYPGETFTGTIAFIDPFLNKATRTYQLRVNVDNIAGKLKPGMFVTAIIKSKLLENGQAQKNNPQKLRDRVLTIPHTAPITTGKRAVVYIEKKKHKYDDEGEISSTKLIYEAREVTLGPKAGNYYVVLSGLEEGEVVVSKGAFKIDSALQILAKPSMMTMSPQEKDHSHHSHQHENSHKKDIVNLWTSHKKLHKPMNNVLSSYLKVGEILALDKVDGVQQEKIIMLTNIAKIHSAIHGKSPLSAIHSEIVLLQKYLQQMKGSDLATIRRDFFDISNTLIRLLQSVGHHYDGPLYLVHCTMYRHDLGGSWIQSRKRINNPYFGSQMRRCGDIEATFTPTK